MQAASRTDLLIARGSQSWTKKYWPSVATRHYFRREEYTHEQGIALSEYNSGSSTVGFDNGHVTSVVNGEFFSKTAPR